MAADGNHPEVEERNGAGSLGGGETPKPVVILTQAEREQRQAHLLRLARSTSVGGLGLLKVPSFRFEEVADEKEERSKKVPSEKLSIKEGVRLPVLGDVKWVDLRRDAWRWLHSPLNLLLLVWMIAVVVSGAILFMVMVGMLNAVIPEKKDRNVWFEVNNQIINGLFTSMCLIVQPARTRAAIRLYRWNPHDIVVMRSLFNKDGERKRHEWKHMVVVVTLLNLNCLCQYILCGFDWGYTRAKRPPIAVAVLLTSGIATGSAAALYNILSPLGQDSPPELLAKQDRDLEGGVDEVQERLSNERKARLAMHNPVSNPQWQGGLVSGFCENSRVAFLSVFCCICVFGLNQERLGFGNKFVHIITFSLFLFAPFFIFDLAAINLNNTNTRYIIGLIGIIWSVLGVFYGGYWRWKMRVTYKLPKRNWCLGHAATTDLFTWFFCSWCALAQEVRTGERYEPVDGKFYRREDVEDVDQELAKDQKLHSQAELPISRGHGEIMSDVELMAPRVVEMELPLDYRDQRLKGDIQFDRDASHSGKDSPRYSTPDVALMIGGEGSQGKH